MKPLHISNVIFLLVGAALGIFFSRGLAPRFEAMNRVQTELYVNESGFPSLLVETMRSNITGKSWKNEIRWKWGDTNSGISATEAQSYGGVETDGGTWDVIGAETDTYRPIDISRLRNVNLAAYPTEPGPTPRR